MMFNTPQTLVRAGRYDGSLEDAVKKCSEPLTVVSVGLGNTIKYATFKETGGPYLLMVSQQRSRLVTAGYNVLLTITSRSDERNQQVSEQFENETGIALDVSVPEQLKRNFSMMNLSFGIFEKNPQAAMAFLRGECIF